MTIMYHQARISKSVRSITASTFIRLGNARQRGNMPDLTLGNANGLADRAYEQNDRKGVGYKIARETKWIFSWSHPITPHIQHKVLTSSNINISIMVKLTSSIAAVAIFAGSVALAQSEDNVYRYVGISKFLCQFDLVLIISPGVPLPTVTPL